ncbi:MAG: hypothetical protein Q7S84_02895 [bacterium]|nr:hypothetical protein [bacterium]
MKSFFAIVGLIGFAGAMLFGTFLMVHAGNAGSHTNCPPALMGTSECNMNISPLEYVQMHLGALTGLTNAIPAFGALAALAALIILRSATGVFRSSGPFLAPQERHAPPRDSIRHAGQEKSLKWTARHEKRDPSFVFAVST